MSASIEGPPQRGGRGGRRRRPRAASGVAHHQLQDTDVHAAPRTGAKAAVMETVRQIPHYLKLLVGLARDRRVSILDKLLVVAAIAYVLSPLDLIPDTIPFLGEVDDIFLVLTSLQRLISNAGRHVVLDHWQGAREELHDLNIGRALSAAAFFLPPTIRRQLRRIVKRRRSGVAALGARVFRRG